MTAEHVWPQWIAKHLPEEPAPHFAIAESEGKPLSVEYRGERMPFTTAVNCVCGTCNSGWMHELETSVAPILAPLIEDRPQTWHEWRQAVAAAWALKTAIMIEQAARDKLRAIPSELYPGFRKWLRPPINSTQIWAARYVGDSPHFYGRGLMRLLLTTTDGTAVSNDLTAYGGCLQVGALVFLLFGHLIQDGPLKTPTDHISRFLVPIWPASPLAEWPPQLAVDDGGLEMLVKSLGDVPPAAPIRPGPSA